MRCEGKTPVRLIAVIIGYIALCLMAEAQPWKPAPRIGYAYPAGGRQGAVFQVIIGGQNLVDCAGIVFTGEGVTAKVLECNRPLTNKEFTELRDQAKELREKKAAGKDAWTSQDAASLAAVLKKLENRPNRQGNPAIAETVLLELSIAPEARPGDRELRLRTPTGLSNPLLFNVGQLQEFSLQDARQARIEAKPGRSEQVIRPRTNTLIKLPATINGQVLPGEVDRFRFQAAKGQKLVAKVRARSLIPYLADAVPGWFQATLALCNSKGKELAYDDSYSFDPDPVLFYQIPADGEYYIEIKDSIFRGREDFVYRIDLGELPFVTAINPLGGRSGRNSTVDLKGWNLPQDRMEVKGEDRQPSLLRLAVSKDGILSNSVAFSLDSDDEVLEAESNNTQVQAQLIKAPVVVNGVIGKPGDVDVYRLEGKMGDEIELEIFARRLNSPLDSALRVIDAKGNQLAFNDDHEDKGSGLSTHHADSRVSLKLPNDGPFFIEVADAQHKGSPDHAYRLQAHQPRPDFELRVVPSSITARLGDNVPLTVYALRRGGFDGAITISPASGLGALSLSGAIIPPGQSTLRMTLSPRAVPREEPYDIAFEGRAQIGDKILVRTARPAEDMMQAFSYRHLVVAETCKLELLPKSGRMPALSPIDASPLILKPGSNARLGLALRAGPPRKAMPFQFALSEPPEGVSLVETKESWLGEDLVVACDSAKAKPGGRGNLLVAVYFVKEKDNAKGKAAAAQRQLVGYLPAIAYEIRAE